MRTVFNMAQVDASKCNGDKLCENVCPTGAIKVSERKAGVDKSKCAACRRCEDVCREEAITMAKRDEPLVLGLFPEELEKVDRERVDALCKKAELQPNEPICMCTMARAKDLGAAILLGAKTPEELSLKTGVRTNCAMWCSTFVQRMLEADGQEIPKDSTIHSVSPGVWNIPKEIAEKYPEYCIEDDQKAKEEGTLDSLNSYLW